MTKALKINLFSSDDLNEIGTKIIELDNLYVEHLEEAESRMYSAFQTRWEYGKLISENYDLIKEECGSQKAFADTIGKSEATISNNKRGYEALLSEGADTWEKVKEHLQNKNIKPTVKNFEKIGNLLNAPDEDRDEEEQKSRDEQRLLKLRDEIEEIYQRNERDNPIVSEEAKEAMEDVDEIRDYIASFDPEKKKWNNEKYLDFLRKYGKDVITGKPEEHCDPHHTTPTGGSGGEGEKLPDYYAIPVSRTTHIALESGLLKVTPEDILKAQFECLTAYLTLITK